MHIKLSAWKFFLVVAIVCAVTAVFFQLILKSPPQTKIENAQQEILSLENKILQSLDLISGFSADSQFHEFFIHINHQSKGFSFFYFENNKLKYWSDNEIVLPENLTAVNISPGTLLRLPNGIYDAFEKTSGNKKIVGLILLYQSYSYENKYLNNHFNPLLQLDQQFISAEGKGEYTLSSLSGHTLLSVNESEAIPDSLPFQTPASFYLLAFAFLISAISIFFRGHNATLTEVVISGIVLFLLRYIMIHFHFPGALYYNDFFSPKVYGSSFFFNSIGDLLLNALSLFAFTGIIRSHFKGRNYYNRYTFTAIFLLTIGLAILSALFYSLHMFIGDLALNSKISFDPTVSEIDTNTLTAAGSVLLLLWSFYALASGLLLPFPDLFSGKKYFENISAFRSGLLALLVISVYASVLIGSRLKEKKTETQKLFAQRLDSRRDPLAEYLFRDLENRITADSMIKEIIEEKKDLTENISRHLQQNYFTGYFSRFEVVVSVFDSEGNLFDSISSNTDVRLSHLISKSTTYGQLIPQQDESGKLKYISFLSINDSSASVATISVTLTARSSQLAEGFPELLISNTVINNKDESGYSYARYSNGSLIYAGGNFPYAFHTGIFGSNNENNSVLSSDGFEHVLYRPTSQALIVVSRPQESFFDRLSLFSFILLFFLTVFLFVHFIIYLLQRKNQFRLTLKQRIRSSIISLVVISFVMIAAGTSFYIVRKYDTDKNKTILSRLNAMWFAITDQFNFDKALSANSKSQWTGALNNIVTSFNLDFNLYDEAGNLYYSSQPKLFEKGILSIRINPEAYYEMRRYGKTQYVHAENIGTLNFAAAYAPFTDRYGNIAGYLNLPYFEKQNELNKEISGFLSALINIYLLLLVVALFLALVITSRITKPLLLIQERLSMTKLGGKNEMIEWKRDDEIGQLVQQYNKMVEALEVSADKLSRSERESAWREMAQQVAHEIKNPLTPMKLSMQHLQRAWIEKSGNLDELFQRISKMMIEQIDALSNIASEFSNFAKMPQVKNESLELKEIISSSISLFNESPGITFTYSDDGEKRIIIADREQLIRAFSNLIKNAIQSVPDERKGEIKISVNTDQNKFHIAVADNGSGIPTSLQSRIFTPSFTTKSSGMGLGLAIVKSIIEAMGGAIHFETTEGIGTVFHVYIPQKKE